MHLVTDTSEIGNLLIRIFPLTYIFNTFSFHLHNIPNITRTLSQKNQLIQNVGARLLTGIRSCSH